MSEVQPVFKDKSGKTLAPGDLIVYGHALGRCAGLRYGKVIGIQWSLGRGDKKPKLKVHGLNDDGSWAEWWEISSAKLANKKSVLEFPSRVIKIEANQMPHQYQKLFDTVPVEVEQEVNNKRNRLTETE